MTVSEVVKPDGVITVNQDTLDEILESNGQLDIWNRVKTIVAAKVGLPANDEEQAIFDRERNVLFLQVIENDLDLEPLEALL